MQPTLVSKIKPSNLQIGGVPILSTQFLISSKKPIWPPTLLQTQSAREQFLRIRDCMHQHHFIYDEKMFCMHCHRLLGNIASSNSNPYRLVFNGFFDEPPSKIVLGDKDVPMTPYVFPSDPSKSSDVQHRYLKYLSKAKHIVYSHNTSQFSKLQRSQA